MYLCIYVHCIYVSSFMYVWWTLLVVYYVFVDTNKANKELVRRQAVEGMGSWDARR